MTTAVIKGSPEYLMGGTDPPETFVLCPQCKGGRIFPSNTTCPRCGYKGPGHVYTLTTAIEVVVRKA